MLACDTVQLEADCSYMQAAGQHCILVTRGEETGQCNVILCDAIGTPVDSNATMVEPLCLTMTSTHFVAASGDTVFVWLYSPASGNTILELLHAEICHCGALSHANMCSSRSKLACYLAMASGKLLLSCCQQQNSVCLIAACMESTCGYTPGLFGGSILLLSR